MEIIVAVDISIDDIHSEWIGFVSEEVFLIENDIRVLLTIGNGDKIREDIMLFGLERTHFDSHVFVIPWFRQLGVIATPRVLVNVVHFDWLYIDGGAHLWVLIL